MKTYKNSFFYQQRSESVSPGNDFPLLSVTRCIPPILIILVSIFHSQLLSTPLTISRYVRNELSTLRKVRIQPLYLGETLNSCWFPKRVKYTRGGVVQHSLVDFLWYPNKNHSLSAWRWAYQLKYPESIAVTEILFVSAVVNDLLTCIGRLILQKWYK